MYNVINQPGLLTFHSAKVKFLNLVDNICQSIAYVGRRQAIPFAVVAESYQKCSPEIFM